MRFALASLCLLLVAALAPCGSRIILLCYNVQNLFDDRADGDEYPEYRPPEWTPTLAAAKLAAVARAIRRASATAPDLIAFQEVENQAVLLRLRDRHLASYGYRYAIVAEQQGVATHTALLSRLPVTRTAVHAPGSFDGQPLRYVLEVEVEHQGRRLVILNNHWKSKTGGPAATADGRRRAAALVRRRLEEILAQDPAADVLVLGDLNENLEDLPRLLPARAGPPARGGLQWAGRPEADGPAESESAVESQGLWLYEPWLELPPEERGSSAYRGRWQTADHILLAPGLFDELGFSYRPGGFRVARQAHLIDPDSGFPRAFRSKGGGIGGGGTSDHLPLILELEVR